MVGRPRKDASNLSAERMVEAAWELVDKEGVAALSTRSLAKELGVQSPALYWHVKNKQQLMGLMVEHILGDPIEALEAGGNWGDWLRSVVKEQRKALLNHKDSGIIMMSTPPTERLRTVVFPQLIKPLVRAGLPAPMATAAGGAVASFLLGWILYEQREETRQMIEAYHDPDTAFEEALDAIVLGIETKARAAGVAV